MTKRSAVKECPGCHTIFKKMGTVKAHVIRCGMAPEELKTAALKSKKAFTEVYRPMVGLDVTLKAQQRKEARDRVSSANIGSGKKAA